MRWSRENPPSQEGNPQQYKNIVAPNDSWSSGPNPNCTIFLGRGGLGGFKIYTSYDHQHFFVVKSVPHVMPLPRLANRHRRAAPPQYGQIESVVRHECCIFDHYHGRIEIIVGCQCSVFENLMSLTKIALFVRSDAHRCQWLQQCSSYDSKHNHPFSIFGYSDGTFSGEYMLYFCQPSNIH